MKKLIAILSSISMTAVSTVAVVSCTSNETAEKDEQGRVVLSSIKNLDKDLGYIPNPTEESILTSFIEQNKELLIEGTTVDNFYILIDGTKATINGSNDLAKNSIYSISASSSIEVTYSLTEVSDPTPNPDEKIKLNSLDLTLDLGAVTNSNYKTIQAKFYEINKSVFATGVTATDFYVKVNESALTAIITGANSSNFFTNTQEDGVTVSFVVDTTNQFKISEHSAELDLNMGSFPAGSSKNYLKPLLTKVFLEKNLSVLPEGTTTENLYVASGKIDLSAKTAWITGSNEQNIISSQETDGLQITFSYDASELSTMNLTTSFKAESNRDADIIAAFVSVNSSSNLIADKLQVIKENDLTYIATNDETIYTGRVQINVSLLIKLQELQLNNNLGDIQENSYNYILSKFVEVNQSVLTDVGLTRNDLWVDTESIQTTSAIIKASTGSEMLSQSSTFTVNFTINDTRIELDSTLELVTNLGELESNANSILIAKFVELNQIFFTDKKATTSDLWISSSSGVTTETGSTIQASSSSQIFKSKNGGIAVTFTLKAVEDVKVELSEVDGVNFDLGEISIAAKGSEGKKRPSNWKDVVGLFLEQNKNIPVLSSRVVEDFSNNPAGTTFSYNNTNENSKSMTITFTKNHKFFTGSINITYVLLKA